MDITKTQRLEGMTNHKSEYVTLQFITDSRRRLFFGLFFVCLNKNTEDSTASDWHSSAKIKSNRVREQDRPEPALYRMEIAADVLPMVNEDIEFNVTLSEASPGGRTDNNMASVGRIKKRSFSSMEDEFRTRLTTPSTREQNDISMVATAAYFSGSIVMLVAFWGRQNIELASVPVEVLNNWNLPATVLEIGTKFASINICKSVLEVSLMYTITLTETDSKKSTTGVYVRLNFMSSSEARPSR
jgi:hypothetical protein